MADWTDPDNTALPQYSATTSLLVNSTESQSHPGGVSVTRTGGATRYETAVGVSVSQWSPGSAGAVVLARGDAAPDALAGVPLAAHVHGPLLLTDPATLDPSVRREVDRVLGGPQSKKTIYILGGTGAVSQGIEDGLRSAGYTVVRLGGASRFETALKIAGQFGPTSRVIVATGLNFPDALSAGPLGAAENAPIVLTSDSATDSATAAFIRQHAAVDPVGGQAQKAVAALHLPGSTAVDPNLAGADRYHTATAVAAKVATVLGHAPSAVALASGTTFPDALTGGAYAANAGQTLVLTDPLTLTPATAEYLQGLRMSGSLKAVEIFGGPVAVSPGIESAIRAM
jgi:putative cell wall-binding protein